MEFKTVIDYEVLKIIVSNAAELHDRGFLFQHDVNNNYEIIKDRQSCLTILCDFFKTFDEYGVSNVIYNPKSYLPKGRLWADSPSVQGISRTIRHTICQNTMVDLDIKNAHPTFLKRLCLKYDIPHYHLNRYINDRESVLNECILKGVSSNKEDAKRLILKIINGGGSYNIDQYPWLRGFSNEMSSMRKKLIDDHFPEYYDIAKTNKGKNYNNLYGSALNLMLCVEERKVLDKMILFCDKNKLSIGALCHDGLMLIKQDNIDYEDYARQMTEECGIKIVVKKMDELIPIDNLVAKEIDCIDTIDPYLMGLLERADNLTEYTILPIYIRMRPTVIDNFKYMRDCDNKYSSWFEKKPDGRWFQNQEPLFLSKDIAKILSFYCNEKIKILKNKLKQLQDDADVELNNLKENFKKEMDELKSGGYLKKQEKELMTKHKKKLKEGVSNAEAPLKEIKTQITEYIKRKEYFQTSNFRRGLINELRTEVLDYDILNKLDSNKNLLGFNNGVYDFEKMCFRPIGQNDYVQKTVGYEFPTQSDPKKRQFIENTFKSMFIRKYAIRLTQPDYDEEDDPEEVENYECAMDSIAYSLAGGNPLQKFYIWIGDGSNGKSVTQNAIKNIMGDYTATIDVCAITNSKKGSNATSDLPKAKGCRQLFTSESDNTDVLNQAYMKRLSGGEDICEREVFKKSITFTPQFVVFLLTNSAPQFKNEQSLARRLFMVFFKFKFFASTDDVGFLKSELNKTHFLGKDYNLEDKLKDCKEEFMLFLIERFQDIKKRGLVVSKQFVNKTQEYMDEQDSLKLFIMEEFVKTEDKSCIIKHKRILDLYNDTVPPFKRICNDNLTRKMKELSIPSQLIHGTKYYYLRLKTDLEHNPQG